MDFRNFVTLMMEDDFRYYIDNQNELVKKYNGKYIVIKDLKVIGAYDSQKEAYNESLKSNKLGTFLIQHCFPGPESYTSRFHSRAIVNPKI